LKETFPTEKWSLKRDARRHVTFPYCQNVTFLTSKYSHGERRTLTYLNLSNTPALPVVFYTVHTQIAKPYHN